MPRALNSFNRALKQFAHRITNTSAALKTALVTCESNCESEIAEEISFLLSTRAELDSLFEKVTGIFDNIPEEIQDTSAETSLSEQTVAYESLVFEIQNVIKRLKTNESKIKKATNEEVKRFQDEKDDTIRSEIECMQQKRHEELLELQLKQLNFQEKMKEIEQDRLKTSRNQIKLHPIKPMKFDGDPKQFACFMSNWEATVDIQDLTDEIKLRYLQDALGPGPRNTIISLKSGAQYELAMSLLKNKYGNEVTVKKAYYESLEALDIIRNPCDISALRRFAETVEIFCHGMKECGVDAHNQDFIFHLIFRKLPEAIRLEFSKKVGGLERLNLRTMIDMLNEHVNIAQSVDIAQETHIKDEQCFYESSKTKKFDNRSHRYDHNRGKFEEKRAKHRLQTRKPISACAFCKKPNHWSEDCRKYSTREARLSQLGSCCLKCFKTNHSTEICYKTLWCPHCRTENSHNRSLCPQKFNSQPNESENRGPSRERYPNTEEAESKPRNSENALIATDNEYIVFPTAMAQVKRNPRSTPRRCLIAFDTMSSRSYITKAVAQQLGITKKFYERLSVHTFASSQPKTISSYRSEIDIDTIDGGAMTIEVSIVNSIEARVTRAPIDSWEIRKQLKDFKLADPRPIRSELSAVDILIGNDYYDIIVQSQRHELSPGKLWLKESLLGWLITGRATSTEHYPNLEACNMSFYAVSDERPNIPFRTGILTRNKVDFMSNDRNRCDFSDLWKLDSIGILDSPIEDEDKIALQSFENSIELRKDRYYVRLPWISDQPELPTNSALALGRLRSMHRKFGKSDTWDIVDKIIKDQESTGIIEKVDHEQTESGVVHYIPHQIVTKDDSATTKVRLVFDASAKTKKSNLSLNECLLRGPVAIHDLPGILMRIRFKPILTVSDIEAAFLQVGIQETDRDCTRFFWINDKLKEPAEDNLITFRFTRVPFGIISSPFLLSQTISHHVTKYHSPLAQKITENLYVDNVFTCFDSAKEAYEFYNFAKSIFQDASMNLRQWSSNSQDFLERLPNSDKAKEPKQKLLGLQWDTLTDTIIVQSPQNDPALSLTKANVLKTFSKVFDPNGFFTPYVIMFKLLFQHIWMQRYDWDETIHDEILIHQWRKLTEELHILASHEIPRFIGTSSDGQSMQLLCFTDASSQAYGAVIYVRISDGVNSTTNILFSKAKVKPMSGSKRSNKSRNVISIPRLELLAILIGVRAVTFVEKQLHLPISEIILWSDSIIALSWIRSQKPLKVFVHNRVHEIKQKAPHVDFRYINTMDNPADKLTRGVKAESLIEDNSWWNGPAWLKDPQNCWPSWNFMPFSTETEKEIDEEIISKPLIQFQALQCVESSPYGQALQASRYSKLSRLLRVSALVEKAIKRMRKIETSSDILPSDISCALSRWIQFIQAGAYAEEKKLLVSGKRNKLIKQLNLQLSEDRIIRSHGRLQNSDIAVNARQPILLPQTHPFTSLVILDVHESKNLHPGTSQVLAKLRETYWIPKGRNAVKAVIKGCYICRKHHGGPFQVSEMAPLPSERVSRTPPFTNTGVDYFGPILIKELNQSEKSKIWICLFTCMATRAIHLEVVPDMSTTSFLRAFRKFIARRGTPATVLSDNAKQFKLAKQMLKDLTGPEFNDEIISYMTSADISWKFIPEKSPWFGGFYERLIGLVKAPLRKVIGKSFPCLDELITITTEVEALVNARPLVYVDADRESPTIISPKDFLSLNPKTGIPFTSTAISGAQFDEQSNSTSIQSLWETGHSAVEEFWNLWHTDYLLSLRERYQLQFKQARCEDTTSPQIGTVVLVKDDNLKRGQWKLGRITELIKSRDSETRVALVRMPNGRVIRRAIRLLYPIETSAPETFAHPTEDSETNKGGRYTNELRTEERDNVTNPDRNRTQRWSKLRANEELSRLFH